MIRRPPRSTRTDTLFPYTTLFRSSVGHRVVRIIVEALILPPTVDFRRHVGGLAAKAAQLLDPGVADLAGGKRLRQRVEIILRIGSRAWNGPDIDDHRDFAGAQQVDERLDGTGRVADGEEGKVHYGVQLPGETYCPLQ